MALSAINSGPAGSDVDANGGKVYLDADADTYLDISTDDTIDIYINGAKDFTIGANSFDVLSGSELKLGGVAISATAAEISRTCDVSARIANFTTTPVAVSEASHDGKVITLNKADGTAVTLPAATGSGAHFRIVIGTTITSNTTTIKVTGNDTMAGTAIICNDSDGSVSGFETASDSDTITFNGSTTGGIKGDMVDLIDIAADLYLVRVTGSATGTEATPFSATVT